MDVHFGKATRIFFQTLPWVFVRIAFGIFVGLATILYFTAVFYLIFVVGGLSGAITVVLTAVGIFFFYYGLKFIKKYILYMIKAGHIAVIAHAVKTGTVPKNQLAFGTSRVGDHFKAASGLMIADLVIKAVIKQFNRKILSVTSFLAVIPALQQPLKMLHKALELAAIYVDEAILAHIFVSEDQGSWSAARDGLVLYTKTWKPVLLTTGLIVVGTYVVLFVLFLTMVPFAGFFGNLSPTVEVAGWVFIFAILATAYYGFLDPWIKTVIITTFLIESQNHTPDSESMDYLAEKSSRFTEVLKNAAAEADSEADTQQPTDTPSPSPAD